MSPALKCWAILKCPYGAGRRLGPHHWGFSPAPVLPLGLCPTRLVNPTVLLSPATSPQTC